MKIHSWENLRLSVDAEGVAVLAMDVAGRAHNVFTAGFMADFCAAVDAIVADEEVRGVIVTSAKAADFSLGAEAGDLLAVHEAGLGAVEIRDMLLPFGRALRLLETCGRPVAAAMHASALAGGFEVALACHWRILSDAPGVVVGLPEVRAGLLPGAGGSQRLLRLVGIAPALPLLLSGRHVSAAEALALGLVHELKPVDEVVRAARHWVLSTSQTAQPWDAKGHTIPGGVGPLAAHASRSFGIGLAEVRRDTHDNEPAPLAILSCVYEGAMLPMDRALQCEARHFGALLSGPVARNHLRTLRGQSLRQARAAEEGVAPWEATVASRLAKALEDEWRAQASAGVPAAMRRNAARQVGLSVVTEMAEPPLPSAAARPPAWAIGELRGAWLSAAALEAARWLEEGLIARPDQADVPAVIALGFPAWTGGPLSYIDTLGLPCFIAQCEHLAARLGPRFLPSDWLYARASAGMAMYPTFS
jgi:enoyl-CoA hydratase/carnithine racemase